MKWEPLEGRDLLLLVHSSELTERWSAHSWETLHMKNPPNGHDLTSSSLDIYT